MSRLDGLSESSDWVEMNAELTGREPEEVRSPHDREEDVVEDFSDQIEERRRRSHAEEYEKMENSEWALMSLSEDLTQILEEDDEFWVLQYQSGQLVPLMRADREEYVIDDRNHYSENWLQYAGEEGIREVSVPAIAEQSPKAGILVGIDEVRDNIDYMPRVDGSVLDKAADQTLDGRYVAPGFEQKYRENAEQRIERKS